MSSEVTEKLSFATRFLQIKKSIQSFEEQKLAKRQSEQQNALHQLELICHEQDSIKQSLHQVLNSPESYLYYHELDVLSVKHVLQQVTVQASTNALEQQQSRVQTAYQDTERWKIVLDQYNELNKKQMQSLDQAMLDEASNARYLRQIED
ncbi:flagellar FliJ family protein [Alicyclobacillus ferrooxydans]|uniref:Uncharacterized protein n=1 Tax=Alicyclobacillus ferrooxydans TaxID=471514 RepID=A0A0N8PPI0_9BACL|nr:flagellar FliJ family protein [Alicyclobacillus ferrooxydans]KPV44381.1 hypothetical protein AN477_07055 [Alicyclobacillus ferrooxydans]